MYNPIATYRLQFHKDFTFAHFEKALPYLQKLGVSTIYASPIFESTPGSTHGYDGLNPHTINPEIGTEETFYKLSRHLRKQNIGWLQDIVPNHMAFDPRNPWLHDVLEKGQLSKYAAFFDVAWTGKLFKGRMMVPFLGAPLKDVIANKELKIEYAEGRLRFNYFDTCYPLNAATYQKILLPLAGTNAAMVQWLAQLQQLQTINQPEAYAGQWNELLLQLQAQAKQPALGAALQQSIDTINNSENLLANIAASQEYDLSFWQRTDSKINFRRFFTVNGLIALNIHDDAVFHHHHQYIQKLVDDGCLQGLRIDHIDGLYDPTKYLHDLRRMAGEENYIVVEKILEPGEALVPSWPIQGNSGYDYLAIVNNLFTNKKSEERFTSFYQQLTGDDTPLHEQIRQKKAMILSDHMAGELDNLTNLFKVLNLATAEALESLPADELSLAIGELLVRCPVYRYYGNCLPLARPEAEAVRSMIKDIRSEKPQLDPALNLLEDALLVKPATNTSEENERALRFYQRLMQFTGPLMAKGVEDTLMYTYNRFIAHNEVGDAPEAFGLSADEYHEAMVLRQRDWPLTINATGTHDTKRGEDVRARLNVLTDLPDEWFAHVKEWQQMNADLKVNGAPDDNDEYFIYQTLLGVYAMPGQPEDNLVQRLEDYLQKALREAKTNSNWTTPNEAYEEAVKGFAVLLLDKQRPFWKSFSAFHRKVAGFGVINSLVQVLMKFTSPGLPDTYQGCEGWDLSMVDPDNRRPVDYAQLTLDLHRMDEAWQANPEQCLANLWTNRFNPGLKQWLTHSLFSLRRQLPDVFSAGEYIPLQVQGRYRENIIAFARRYRQQVVLVAAPLHMAELCLQQQQEPEQMDWADTRIVLPANIKGEARNVLLKKVIPLSREVYVQDLFTPVPLAVISVQQPAPAKRAAGVLMHITSLPSAFGIGDLGPEARRFADFLARSGQQYWQILPLNPTEQGQGHSPYSAICSLAGNTLLISPEMLLHEGLLQQADLPHRHLPTGDRVDFEGAAQVRRELLDLAWQNFNQGAGKHLRPAFDSFCKREKQWLHYYALYLVLKEQYAGKAWFQWPDAYKLRDSDALSELSNQHQPTIQKIQWLQFLFMHQWKDLRSYCNQQGIQLFGDLPFYSSYDSMDVWANTELFAVDEAGRTVHMAGVPPDRFSADGQLWGMPVFNWDVLKQRGYDWWIDRLRKNMELFDLLRLDHFRAFSDYWQVPAGETTARNGKWVTGPREHFFRLVKKRLGDLPFIAEDLGDIDEPVYTLRDEFGMPGMKVLHFAFGDGMAQNTYIPHNYSTNFVVYPGTHDNNTSVGWWRRDATQTEKGNLERYTGRSVNDIEVHDVLNRLAWSSVARLAIISIQDVLGLPETARMNKPASVQNNWIWRLQPGQVTNATERYLKQMMELYNR